MKILNRRISLERFWETLASADESVLFLDYDGTLAPFSVDRDEAVPYPWVAEILNAVIKKGGTRLVIISGREIGSVQKLLKLENPVEIWGCHGRQHLLGNGEMETKKVSPAAEKLLSDAQDWIEDHGLSKNMEEKSGCLALHFRGMKARMAGIVERQATEAFEAMLPGTGMELDRFDGGIELRSEGVNKGVAVEKVLEDYEETPPCAYLGDDFTDEDAFKAIKGRGLGILVREEFRPTQADIWIRPPEELRDFLYKWKEKSRGKML